MFYYIFLFVFVIHIFLWIFYSPKNHMWISSNHHPCVDWLLMRELLSFTHFFFGMYRPINNIKLISETSVKYVLPTSNYDTDRLFIVWIICCFLKQSLAIVLSFSGRNLYGSVRICLKIVQQINSVACLNWSKFDLLVFWKLSI